MPRYKKKPIIVEAIRWDGSLDTLDQIKALVGGRDIRYGEEGIQIDTLEGVVRASIGDFIIQGVSGEVYPCKPAIFDKTYDLVEGE